MNWKGFFVVFCIASAGLFYGIMFHEFYHYASGYPSEICVGTMHSTGMFYVHTDAPLDHPCRNEMPAYAITLGVMASFIYAGKKMEVIP